MKDNNKAKSLQLIDRTTYNPIKLIITIVCCWVWMPALAQTQQFNIPAQSLDNALTELADAANMKLFYQSSVVGDKQSHAVSGNYTPKQALDIMLDGTGLNIRSTGTNAVTIEKQTAKMVNQNVALVGKEQVQGSGGDTTLPKVTVEADSAYDPDYYADPYNKDYVIPNATSGTKTDTPIMETPLNVQSISKQVLKDQQVISLDQALKNVSGVTTNNSGTKNSVGNLGLSGNFFLRGFESGTFFRDGFRLQSGSASRGLANVEGVEVLKGPAAILYGQVEPGGMVNVITKQPLATPYYALGQQFGSYDMFRTTLDATGPVTDDKSLLYRVNFSYQDNDSFRDFVDNKNVFVAPVLRWNISPRTQATFEFEYSHQNQNPDNALIPFPSGHMLNIPRKRNYDEHVPVTNESFFGSFNWSHQFNDDWSIKHRFSINQARQTISNGVIASFIGDSIVSPGHLVVFRDVFASNAQTNTYATNLDLTGHFNTWGLQHTLLLGGDYYRTDSLSSQAQEIFGLPSEIDLYNPVHPGTALPTTDPFFNGTNKTDQYGLYIQDQIKLPYNVHVMGGIRYQYIHQFNFGALNPDIFGPPAPAQITTQDAVTPRVGILWQPQNWLSLYANYAENFGANAGRIFPASVIPPTSAEQYEGGIKTEFFGGRLRATLAYYDLTKTNVATQDLQHRGFSKAIGAIRSRGPELDIQGEILPGWNMIATYSNTDAKIVKSNSSAATFDAYQQVGTRMFNVPQNMGSLWSTYEIQSGDLKGFRFGGGVTLRDGQRACCDFPAFSIPGYTTYDLMMGYGFNVGKAKLSAQLNVTNITDKNYFTGLYTFGGAFPNGGSFVNFGTPRTFMGSINVQY